MTVKLSRRTALLAAATLPAMAALPALPARAAAEKKGPSTPLHYRFDLGQFEVNALLAGSLMMENPQRFYGTNVSPEDFAAASAAAFLPADRMQNFFTPTLINTGSELILVDAGMQADGIVAAMADAGYTPDQVDVVVISHMHADHFGGLAKDGVPTFPNARYVAGAIENNHWAAAGNQGYDGVVRPLLEKFTFLDENGTVASGITAINSFGHTPGHFAFHLESEGKRLLLTADMANHAVWSIANPDWEVMFDMDKAAAAESRRRVLGMAAADRVPFLAYHLAFPGIGYVEAQGDGFRHIPVSYQLLV